MRGEGAVVRVATAAFIIAFPTYLLLGCSAERVVGVSASADMPTGEAEAGLQGSEASGAPIANEPARPLFLRGDDWNATHTLVDPGAPGSPVAVFTPSVAHSGVVSTTPSASEVRPEASRVARAYQSAAPRPTSASGPLFLTDRRIRQQFATASLDDDALKTIRGGLDVGSGVELSFAFQQATFVGQNLVQNIVVPTITVTLPTAPSGAPTALSTSSSLPTGGVSSSTITAALAGLGVVGAPTGSTATAAASTTVVSNGSSLQLISAVPAAQSVSSNGASSIVTTLGGNGLTTVVANTADNQAIRQMTTINIGITGLQQLLQQGVSSSITNRLNSVMALSP